MREWRSSRDYSLCTRSVSVRIVGKDKVMGNAVTIIAGAVLDFDHKGVFPSVKKITDEVN